MKRNILFSLMMIGAVAALISGATFSAFTDSATVTGSITAGNVQVGIGQETLSWSGTDCPGSASAIIGSGDDCTSSATVDYTGNLPATMDLVLVSTPSVTGCFTVTATWSVGSQSFVAGVANTIQLLNVTAEDGTVSVTVSLPTNAPNNCQSATLGLNLTVSTEEVVN